MLDRFYSAESTREDARTIGTHAKLKRIWNRWELFLQVIKLKEDPLLNNIAAEYRPTLIRYFTAVVREREFLRNGKSNLDQGTTK